MEKIHTVASLLIEAREVLNLSRKTIEEEGIVLRKTSGLDLILGAHLNRVFQGVESVFVLAAIGAGHDATALSRVVLEHAISAVSISMSEDPERESYLFITAQHRHVRNSHKALKKHYPDLPEPDSETAALVQSLVEQVDQSKFRERLHNIVEKLDELHSPNERMFSWLYEVPYGAMSNYVHARALGLRTMAPPLGEPFVFLQNDENQLCMNAIRHAVMGLLVVCLAVVRSWANPSMAAKLTRPSEEFVRRSGRVGEIGPYEI